MTTIVEIDMRTRGRETVRWRFDDTEEMQNVLCGFMETAHRMGQRYRYLGCEMVSPEDAQVRFERTFDTARYTLYTGCGEYGVELEDIDDTVWALWQAYPETMIACEHVELHPFEGGAVMTDAQIIADMEAME